MQNKYLPNELLARKKEGGIKLAMENDKQQGIGESDQSIVNICNPKKQGLRVHIHRMWPCNMSEVCSIEAESFESPWDEADFTRCLNQRQKICIGMVAEHDEHHVVGFIIYELCKNNIEILNMAVDPEFRRRGVGSQMVAKLFCKLSPQRRNRITLEVRETNLPAQLFFRDCGEKIAQIKDQTEGFIRTNLSSRPTLTDGRGFRAVKVLRGFYDDTHEDAHLMQYKYKSGDAEKYVPANRISWLAG